MGSLGSLRTRAVAAVAAAGALALVVGCSSSDDSVTGGGKEDGKTTITMGLYGVMGIKETGLLEQYEKENPDVDIKAEIAGDEQTYYTALQTRLAAGKGLKDIQGIEIGRAKGDHRDPGGQVRGLLRDVGDGPLPALEGVPDQHRGRQGAGPGHRHRPDGRLLPQGLLREGRPAHRP